MPWWAARSLAAAVGMGNGAGCQFEISWSYVMPSSSEKVYAVPLIGEKLRGHFEIARVDHWFKNVFMLPGVAVALSLDPGRLDGAGLWIRVALSVLSICLVASSNYSINELLDARYDKLHPTKADRPVPSGRVYVPLVYVQCVAHDG